MKFVDEAIITVQSGDGGRGCVSFRREKFVPRGGPDGGDGGKGGDVVLKATGRKHTLYHLQFKRLYKAGRGAHGQGSQKTGRSGANLVIEVPPGTIVKNAATGEVICDLDRDGARHVVARGGRGGLGNRRFRSSTNRAPRYAQPGEPGVTLDLKLELKLLADAGLVGLPNAGKSTLISAISAARPKIADYPFTTLTPNLGVVAPAGMEPFVVADIPGLIEGAHQGAGLGIRFLRHVERCSMVIHIIDAAAIDPENPLQAYRTINNELQSYSPELAAKPQLVVLNKLDLPQAKTGAEAFCQAMPEGEIFTVSAATGQGLDKLVKYLGQLVQASHADTDSEQKN